MQLPAFCCALNKTSEPCREAVDFGKYRASLTPTKFASWSFTFRQDSKLYAKPVKLLCTPNLHMCLNMLLKPKEANLEGFFRVYFVLQKYLRSLDLLQ